MKKKQPRVLHEADAWIAVDKVTGDPVLTDGAYGQMYPQVSFSKKAFQGRKFGVDLTVHKLIRCRVTTTEAGK